MKDDHSLEELVKILHASDEAVIPEETVRRISGVERNFTDTLRDILKKTEFTVGETAVAYSVYQKATEAGAESGTIQELVSMAMKTTQGRKMHGRGASKGFFVRRFGEDAREREGGNDQNRRITHGQRRKQD